MMSPRRVRQQQLVDMLYERRATHEVQSMMVLLNLLFEEAKHTLVTCDPTAVCRVQGEAQTYEKLIRMLTRPGLKDITPKE